MDSEDNWQRDCDVKWILETAVFCVCVCVSERKTERERFVMLTWMAFVISPVCIFYIDIDMFRYACVFCVCVCVCVSIEENITESVHSSIICTAATEQAPEQPLSDAKINFNNNKNKTPSHLPSPAL